jgi:cell division septal protein FtsQ
VRRRLLAVLLILVAAGAVYWFALRKTTVESHLVPPRATAVIGSGSNAVAVGADGQLLAWLPLPEAAQLPKLPLSEPPRGGELGGPVLQQARVLGAAPPALRPYLASSSYGEDGIDVKLRSGIELRFGDASRAVEKWRAAAAVLADPSVTALDYVDLHAPGRPAIGGSGHTLPPPG